MRHRRDQIKLSRTSAHRRALFRNLLSSLIIHGSIITTEVKAKEVKRRIDALVSKAKANTLHARRMAARELFGAEAVKTLFSKWVPAMADRESGFTRLVRIGPRKGDGAPLALIEMTKPVQEEEKQESP